MTRMWKWIKCQFNLLQVDVLCMISAWSREMSDGILKSLEYSIEQFVLFLHQIKSNQINYRMKNYSLYFRFQALLFTVTAIEFRIIYIMQTKYEGKARKLFIARKLDHHHHMTKMHTNLFCKCLFINNCFFNHELTLFNVILGKNIEI